MPEESTSVALVRPSFHPDRALVRPDLNQLLRYDNETQHTFVGDYAGQISLLRLERQKCSVITTLKGHEGKWDCRFTVRRRTALPPGWR